jgi:hypothetical protein
MTIFCCYYIAIKSSDELAIICGFETLYASYDFLPEGCHSVEPLTFRMALIEDRETLRSNRLNMWLS